MFMLNTSFLQCADLWPIPRMKPLQIHLVFTVVIHIKHMMVYLKPVVRSDVLRSDWRRIQGE